MINDNFLFLFFEAVFFSIKRERERERKKIKISIEILNKNQLVLLKYELHLDSLIN
jgi:hypothetical protein